MLHAAFLQLVFPWRSARQILYCRQILKLDPLRIEARFLFWLESMKLLSNFWFCLIAVRWKSTAVFSSIFLSPFCYTDGWDSRLVFLSYQCHQCKDWKKTENATESPDARQWKRTQNDRVDCMHFAHQARGGDRSEKCQYRCAVHRGTHSKSPVYIIFNRSCRSNLYYSISCHASKIVPNTVNFFHQIGITSRTQTLIPENKCCQHGIPERYATNSLS